MVNLSNLSICLYIRHVSKTEVRRTTGCSPLSYLVTNRRLRLFGHIDRSSSREDHPWDHHQALAACIRQVSPDWKRPAGRPSHTWLRAIEADLGPLNVGLATAWRKATTRDEWYILWTQQRSSGVRSERRIIENVYQHTKYRQNNSIRGRDITVFVLQKQTSAILKFLFRF